MKNEEDEAFDDLARKQGMWGGGFKAKQAMAKARVEDDDDIQDYKKPWVGLTVEERKSLLHITITDSALVYAIAIEQLLKEKNT